MCSYLALLIPEGVDFDRAVAVGARHGFRPSDDLPETVRRRLRGARILDPCGSCCNCRTAIGTRVPDAMPEAALERESRRGRRATWADARRRRWIEQRAKALDRRSAFARDAYADPGIGRIGIVKHWWSDVAAWPAPLIVVANPESLRHIPVEAPVWLVPTG